MDNAHVSFGSLGNGAHESNKRNHAVKATISRLISNNLPGFGQALVCAVGEVRSPLGSGALRDTGCTGVCRSILLPFGARGVVWLVWCVSEIIYRHCHAAPEHRHGCRCKRGCTWPWCRAIQCLSYMA